MTNAEKYLKDEINPEDFIDFVFNEGNIRLDAKKDCSYIGVLDLLHLLQRPSEQLKPTLSKDERVILSNLNKKIKYIARDKSGYLYVKEQHLSMIGLPFSIYNHLFQFIKNGEEYSIEVILSGN